MNEFNYDYLGINGMIPNNFTDNYLNNIPQNMQQNTPQNIQPNMNFNPNINPNQNMNLNNQNNNNNLLNPTQGFIRGNMFSNLYDPYKNYKPTELNPQNEQVAMLMSYQQYNFALTDLNLYLDNYPNDRNALNLYQQYLKILKETEEEYEKKYGPLKCNSMYTTNGNWNWDNNPWPWEVR